MPIKILCKVLGHKPKQVEGAKDGVKICKRCKEVQDSPETTEKVQDSTPNNPEPDNTRKLRCSHCDEVVESVSRFPGDSCPHCKKGYLDASKPKVSNVNS